MKKSIKTRLAVTFIVLLAVCFTLIGVVQFFFIDGVYLRNKSRKLQEAWTEINSTGDSVITEDFNNYCSANGLSYCVADANLTALYTNSQNADHMAGRLFGNVLDKESDNTKTIQTTDQYKVIEIHDRFTDIDYLELWGQLDNGYYFMVNTPLQGVSEAASISIRFYLIMGAIAIGIGALIVLYMTGRIVKPMRELTDLSQRMAALDFDARYTSGGEDEIGVLGQNFNSMSDELQKAVSELKSANASLQKDIAEKTQIDEMRKEFLANVSHELKTPIALVQGYAEGLKDNVNDDVESREFYCDVIIDEANKMNRLVKQLMTLNQLEFGNDKVSMDRFDLTELINGVIQSSQLLIEKKEASVYFAQKTPLYVWGDEFKIEEVVTNYLTNALNHLDGDCRIEITCREENGVVTTTVFNAGKPIPEEDLDKIWQKFYKVDKARTRSYGGSGIGLSIVKAIMEGHNQNCWATNYDNGVAFSFTLESKVNL